MRGPFVQFDELRRLLLHLLFDRLGRILQEGREGTDD